MARIGHSGVRHMRGAVGRSWAFGERGTRASYLTKLTKLPHSHLQKGNAASLSETSQGLTSAEVQRYTELIQKGFINGLVLILQLQ